MKMLARVSILEGKNGTKVYIQPYKLLRIHVRGIRKSFPFNLHILKPVRRIRRRGSAVESQ